MQIKAVIEFFAIGSVTFAINPLCQYRTISLGQYGDFQSEICPSRPGQPVCFPDSSHLNWDSCCRPEFGPGGGTDCWNEEWTHERCCFRSSDVYDAIQRERKFIESMALISKSPVYPNRVNEPTLVQDFSQSLYDMSAPTHFVYDARTAWYLHVSQRRHVNRTLFKQQQDERICECTASGRKCECQRWHPSWIPCQRLKPRCVFLQIGANNGESYRGYMGAQQYDCHGNAANYDLGNDIVVRDCHAVLVEPNPDFSNHLENVRQQTSSSIEVLSQTAFYQCDGTSIFYIDESPGEFGSSLHPEFIKDKYSKKFEVDLVNLNRWLIENVIVLDTVVVTMDAEGSEWNMLPCLSQSPAATLIDFLYVETHRTYKTQESQDDYIGAWQALRNAGIRIVDHDSPYG